MSDATTDTEVNVEEGAVVAADELAALLELQKAEMEEYARKVEESRIASSDELVDVIAGGYVKCYIREIDASVWVQSLDTSDYSKYRDMLDKKQPGKANLFLLERGMVEPTYEELMEAFDRKQRPRKIKYGAVERIGAAIFAASGVSVATQAAIEARFPEPSEPATDRS